MVESLPILTYTSVVSRDMVRTTLTVAALNDLEVKVSDVQIAFLNSIMQGEDLDYSGTRVCG